MKIREWKLSLNWKQTKTSKLTNGFTTLLRP